MPTTVGGTVEVARRRTGDSGSTCDPLPPTTEDRNHTPDDLRATSPPDSSIISSQESTGNQRVRDWLRETAPAQRERPPNSTVSQQHYSHKQQQPRDHVTPTLSSSRAMAEQQTAVAATGGGRKGGCLSDRPVRRNSHLSALPTTSLVLPVSINSMASQTAGSYPFFDVTALPAAPPPSVFHSNVDGVPGAHYNVLGQQQHGAIPVSINPGPLTAYMINGGQPSLPFGLTPVFPYAHRQSPSVGYYPTGIVMAGAAGGPFRLPMEASHIYRPASPPPASKEQSHLKSNGLPHGGTADNAATTTVASGMDTKSRASKMNVFMPQVHTIHEVDSKQPSSDSQKITPVAVVSTVTPQTRAFPRTNPTISRNNKTARDPFVPSVAQHSIELGSPCVVSSSGNNGNSSPSAVPNAIATTSKGVNSSAVASCDEDEEAKRPVAKQPHLVTRHNVNNQQHSPRPSSPSFSDSRLSSDTAITNTDSDDIDELDLTDRLILVNRTNDPQSLPPGSFAMEEESGFNVQPPQSLVRADSEESLEPPVPPPRSASTLGSQRLSLPTSSAIQEVTAAAAVATAAAPTTNRALPFSEPWLFASHAPTAHHQPQQQQFLIHHHQQHQPIAISDNRSNSSFNSPATNLSPFSRNHPARSNVIQPNHRRQPHFGYYHYYYCQSTPQQQQQHVRLLNPPHPDTSANSNGRLYCAFDPLHTYVYYMYRCVTILRDSPTLLCNRFRTCTNPNATSYCPVVYHVIAFLNLVRTLPSVHTCLLPSQPLTCTHYCVCCVVLCEAAMQ